jgi:hypothetical protein
MTAKTQIGARCRTPGKVAFAGAIALIVALGACQSSIIAAEKPQLAAGAKSSNAAPARSEGDAWRYKYYEGRWWYWMPSNSWAWYDGRRWIAFEKVRRSRTGAILVQRPARGENSERYQSGVLPAPPATFEAMQDEVVELRKSLRRLEARLREQEAAGTASAAHPWSSGDEAKLYDLWQARQAAFRFYDLNSDGYYFNGKGHFTD